MTAGFIVLVCVLMIFFIARGALNIAYMYSKRSYYRAFVLRIFDIANMVAYILLALALGMSLVMAGDFEGKEFDFTLAILLIVATIYVAGEVFDIFKERNVLLISSSYLDLNKLGKSEKFIGLISPAGRYYSVDKANMTAFDEEMAEVVRAEYATKRTVKDMIFKVVGAILPLLLTITVLVVGLLRVAE